MATKRPAASAASAVDSDDASKKAKPEVHEVSFKVVWPPNVSPQTAKLLNIGQESRRAARLATQKATSEEVYGQHDFGKFAKRFEAAVASAFAEEGGPVSLRNVITAMIETGCSPNICKSLKHEFAWNGLAQGRWQISRRLPGKGQVPFPKGSARPSDPRVWRFSPSSAARCLPAGGPV